jgi:hypothetical protein
MVELHILQILIILQALYFVFRNKIDFLLVFFMSFLLYHWQIIYGVVWVPPYKFIVNTQSVYIIMAVASVLQIFVIINDSEYRKVPVTAYNLEKDRDQYPVAIILLFVSILTTAYSLYLAGDKMLLGKSAYASAEGLKYNFFTYYPAAMALLYGVASKRKAIIVFSFAPLLIYLFIGYRAVFVTALVGVIAVRYYGQRLFSLKTFKIILIVCSLFLFFVIYKFSYIDIKAGTFDYFQHKIVRDDRFESVPEFLLWGMFSAEFGQVSSNIVLTSAQDLTDSYAFSDALFGSVTLINRIFGYNEDMTRFSHVIRKEANPGFSYALGSTLWGEMYQAGGYGGVMVMAVIVIGALTFFNLQFRSNKEKYPLVLYFISFLAFYVHRNDFVLLVGNLKNIVYLLIPSYLVLLAIKGKIKVLSGTKKIFQS